jgi:predicted ATPase/DNA-binding SARP family transcriptional activator
VLTCRVLGPTEIGAGAGPVELGGPQPRRLITALIAAEGRPVTDDRLAAAIWGDDVPPQAATSLQSYISRLRRALGRDALPRTSAGYRIEAGRIDAAEFVAEVDRGRALLTAGDATGARRAFAAALALWRGEAYADLDPTPEVVAARGRLDEVREVAVEERLAARLATGDAPGAVAELQASVRAQPYRERRWELLILGLYRGGRQTEALAALRRIRALLADELGVDPGPALQSLERRLLAQDPALLLPAPSTTPVARPLSTFLGRDDELALLTGLLGRHRLVTLIGPGGAGKTRLAVEYAAGLVSRWANPSEDVTGGSWLVRLADVTDPRDVPSAVATAMGVRASTALTAALADRSGLLVLDNCEHLVAAAADLALHLLAHCPGLRVLATSREPLGVDGESTLPVEPLPSDAAVALLTDRIGRIRPGWTPDPGEHAELRQLAAALDGIPLALELAAARARVLGLRELLALLDDRFPALGAVPRGALAPHATLEAAIAWSVDLLAPGDRTLLLRLWPFEGGFPLEAAAAVGSDLDALSSLVTRSVVVADTTVTPARYRMLGLLRAYCRERDPDPAASRAAHAAWVRSLVARAMQDLRGERSAHAIRTLQRELPNVRAAISHDLTVAPAAALRSAGQLDWFWFRGGHVDEGQRLLLAALAAAPDAPAVDRARAWASCAALRFIGGDLNSARAALDEVNRALGAPTDVEGRTLLAQVRYYEAIMWLTYGEFATAVARAEQSVAMGREIGEEWLVASAEMSLGGALVGLGEVTRGRATLSTAIERGLGCGQTWAAAMAELFLARSHLTGPPDPAAALVLLRRALERFRAEDDVGNVVNCLFSGAWALALSGRVAEAATLRAAALRQARRRGLQPEVTDPTGAAALDAALGPAEPGTDQLDEAAMVAMLTAGHDGVHARR